MSSLNSLIATALATARKTIGAKVKYQRGSAWVVVTAIAGSSTYQAEGKTTTSIDFRNKDFLIGAEELVLDGEITEPQEGDVIFEDMGASTNKYEVRRPDGIDQPWRHSDSGQSQLRVHALLVGAIPK